MLEKLCFSLNGSTQFDWENVGFVSCIYFEPGGQCVLLISKDKVKGTEVAKLQFTNRGAFVCFLLSRMSLWQARAARKVGMAIECRFIPRLEREIMIPLFLKKKLFRSKPTVLRTLSSGETFLELFLESLVEVPFPGIVSVSMDMEWPHVVCYFSFIYCLLTLTTLSFRI